MISIRAASRDRRSHSREQDNRKMASTEDPMESMLASALTDADIRFTAGPPKGRE